MRNLIIGAVVAAAVAAFENSPGLLSPPPAEAGASIAVPDTAGDVGRYPSLQLDSAGRPVVSYLDVPNGTMKLLRCGDIWCTSGNSIQTVDTIGSCCGGSPYTSLQLDSSGNPVIAYYDSVDDDLRLVHCTNLDCSGPQSPVDVDNSVNNVGTYASMKLDSSGFPVISYYDATLADLKVAHCVSADCTGSTIVNSPDTANLVGQFTSLVLRSGNPVVSYRYSTGGDLRVLTCNDPNCAPGGDTIATPDTAGDTGWHTSIALEADGRAVVSYHDNQARDLRVLRCITSTCMAGTSATLEAGTDSGVGTSLAIRADGKPVVSYFDESTLDLKLLACSSSPCLGKTLIYAPDTAGSVGVYPSLRLTANNLPVVAYHDDTNHDLKILRCTTQRLFYTTVT
jgi:hypothetical protein